MNLAATLGVGTTAVGLAGYAIGVTTPYPGRAFSVTALMVGIALFAMRGAFGPERDDG